MKTGLLKFDGDATIEAFRHAVLRAIDKTASELFSETGWQDQDLPRLFKAVDAHVETLAERHGIQLDWPE